MWRYTTETGLPRVVLEFQTKQAADEVRRRYGDCCAPEDDARETVVVMTDDALDAWIREAQRIGREVDDRNTTEAIGHVELTEYERDAIDFTETNVPHARACKAIALDASVGDWLAHYDHTLSVAEHRDLYQRGETSMRNLSPNLRAIQ